MRIRSLQTGTIETHDDGQGPAWITATYKSAVPGSLLLTAEGLEGDQQADRRHHGGPDKAVLVYNHDHYAAWHREIFPEPLPPGAFGENILVEAMTEADVSIGDVYAVGAAIVQVSQPRQPCWKQARRWGIHDLVVRMIDTCRCGWYLRVRQPGIVSAGDEFRLLERPHPEWTIPRAHHVMHFGKNDRAESLALAAVAALSEDWKHDLLRRARP